MHLEAEPQYSRSQVQPGNEIREVLPPVVQDLSLATPLRVSDFGEGIDQKNGFVGLRCQGVTPQQASNRFGSNLHLDQRICRHYRLIKVAIKG